MNNDNKDIEAVVHYRGYDVNIYLDDYGQCYYFYFNDEEYSCGTFNFDYEGEVKSIIDNFLDHIEYIRNTKPHHPTAEIKWLYDQESGDRKKVIRYDGFVRVLENQDGDYSKECKDFMDYIDELYDKLHEGEDLRTYISDIMNEDK